MTIPGNSQTPSGDLAAWPTVEIWACPQAGCDYRLNRNDPHDVTPATKTEYDRRMIDKFIRKHNTEMHRHPREAT